MRASVLECGCPFCRFGFAAEVGRKAPEKTGALQKLRLSGRHLGPGSSLLLGHGNNVHWFIPADGFEVQKKEQINQCHCRWNKGVGLQSKAITFQVRLNGGGLRGTTFFRIDFPGSLELLAIDTIHTFEEKPLAWLSG